MIGESGQCHKARQGNCLGDVGQPILYVHETNEVLFLR